MAFFRDDDLQNVDWRLLQNSFVSLYWRTAYLKEDLLELKQLGYRVAEFDCSSWSSVKECAKDLSGKLNIEWNGNSLDALNDLLADIGIPFESGLVLVFSKFDFFHGLATDVAWNILDILALNGRRHLLFGRRLISLLQVDDPKTSFKPCGAQGVRWNSREWLNKNRGL